jgi:hypothetical protein
MDADRVWYLAKSALTGFDTLELEDAVEGAKADLQSILKHVADDTPSVSGVVRVEVLGRDERIAGDAGCPDLR